MGSTTVSLLGSFLGAGGVGLLKLRSASLLVVCRSAKSASELLAEANMSAKLGVAELLGCGVGDRPRSLGVAVMGAACIKPPVCKLVLPAGTGWASGVCTINSQPSALRS